MKQNIMIKNGFSLLVLAGLLAISGGCAKLVGNLMRDLQDYDDYEPSYSSQQATVGGRWSERGFLDESMPEAGPYSDRYAVVGHQERGLASATSRGPDTSGQSWVTDEQRDSNQRDFSRNLENGGNDNISSSYVHSYRTFRCLDSERKN